MRKKSILAYLMGVLLAGCGGGGFTENMPVFKTVTVHITGVNRYPMEVDVLQKTTVQAPVFSRDQNTQQCTSITTADVCAGTNFVGENLGLTFKSEAIKDAAGNPLPVLPSPVVVERYRVRFTGCISGVYEFPVGQAISPDSETQITIQPITIDMKRLLGLTQVPYTYIGGDGCGTPGFIVWAYPSICNALANFEFDLVELTTGKRATIKYSLPVIFSDYTQPDECPR